MAASYEDALRTLYQATPDAFVAERKRLALELKSGGDKEGAGRLAKLPRPTASVWAVNQLWWQERTAFEELFESAQQVRAGDLKALPTHRQVLSKLRARAAAALTKAGHAATEPILRRVTTTLSALAAAGDFAPDQPGTLSADRDPLGFDESTALALASPPARTPKSEANTKPSKQGPSTAAASAQGHPDAKSKREHEAELKRVREAERQAKLAREAELEREAERLEQRRAEQARRAKALEAARHRVERRQAEVSRLEAGLDEARRQLDEARAAAEEAERELST
jgi:hypothetical protein